jgi:hypothetical protein
MYPVREMKPSVLRWLFLAAVVTLLVGGFAGQPAANLGVSVGWTNGRYRFGYGTAPSALGFALVVMTLYFLLMYSLRAAEGQPLPGLFRRFVASWLDFALAIAMLAPITGILPMLTEWRRTGVFQWNFVRTTPFPSDGPIGAIGLALSFVGLVAYYALPLVRRKPSPGSCILGYQIIPEEGSAVRPRTAVQRTLLGFIAACAAWLAPFMWRDRKKGQFWLDKVFRTRAVRLN